MINYKEIKENTSMDFRKKVYRVEGFVEAHSLKEAEELFAYINTNGGSIMIWETE